MKATCATRWFIYRMRCLIGGVGDYIGMTHNPFQREAEHRAKKRGYKLTAAIQLYGEKNFVYEILAECGSEKEARELERKFIQDMGTGWPSGLNVSGAGEGVRADQYEMRRAAQIKAWDDEERRRRHSESMSRAMSTKTAKEHSSAAAKLRWADPGYRAKQSASSTGKKHSTETKEKLRQLKLAASAAKGGPKKKVKKYPGLSAKERGRLVTSRADVQVKIRATWAGNPKNAEKASKQARTINSDPILSARRVAALRKASAESPKTKPSAETRAKMSAAHLARWARIKVLQNPQGSC